MDTRREIMRFDVDDLTNELYEPGMWADDWVNESKA